MGFCEKVDATPDISECCHTGLRAIKRGDRAKFVCDDTRKIEGSVDIDTCVTDQYPGENRWDYAVGYSGRVYFVEIHPADTKNISEMEKKLSWLKQWLKDQNSPLSEGASYHWVASGRVNITPSGNKLKSMVAKGLLGPKRECRCK